VFGRDKNYSSGILRSLFKGKWDLSIDGDTIRYSHGKERKQIRLQDLRSINIGKGILSDEVFFYGANTRIIVKGLTSSDSRNLKSEIEHDVKKLIAESITKNPQLAQLLSKFKGAVQSLLNGKRYIAHSDVVNWMKNLPEVGEYIAHPYFDRAFLSSDIKWAFEEIDAFRLPENPKIEEHNKQFILNEQKKYRQLFDSIESFPLTQEQSASVVINEDRGLLIAAAGSGKSSTIVAKVAYLIESELAKPCEILILAFNKDAQTELASRLEEKLSNRYPNFEQIQNKTFHALGLEMLAQVEGVKPSICTIASLKGSALLNEFNAMIEDLRLTNSDFNMAWMEFVTISKTPVDDLDSFQCYDDYVEYLKGLGASWKSGIGGRKLRLVAIDGTEVKSLEELRICNWLAFNGINYRYEKQYVLETADESHGNYYPDFYYPDIDVYHEHFAIDQNGKAPAFFKDYEKGVLWKRVLHSESGTTLIETHSAHFKDGTVIGRLKRYLSELGQTFNPLTRLQLDTIVKKTFNPAKDAEIFPTFLKHMKANSISMDMLYEKAKLLPDVYRSNQFLKAFEFIYEAYQTRLSSNREIDFEDQIIKACSYVENRRFEHSWKYILVDEFQDISQDRKRFINALLNQKLEAKLFAVGDDWQSIYRFSGADIDIMTNFPDHFGATSVGYLTNTFRSYQELVDVASKFVMRNDKQLKKEVHSISRLDRDLVSLISYSSQAEQVKKLEQGLAKINELAESKNIKLSVFLLARYNHQKPKNLLRLQSQFRHLDVGFKSIHASKGLEADYVFLLNIESGAYGFPNVITDDPILHMVIPQPESFSNAEERRLLYVAITRAKRGFFGLVNQSSVSSFSSELSGMKRVKTDKALSKKDFCPRCHSGALRLIKGKYGLFLGCSNRLCRYTEKPKCPACGYGELKMRKGKYGTFGGCSRYPKCKHITHI